MFKVRTNCRACGNTDLKQVFSFDRPMPLANSFRLPTEDQDGHVPLTVLFCPKCTLSQLRETVDPAVLYHNYPYVTSRSETMRLHFESLWSAVGEECYGESVIEIGSNDGHFLSFARDHGAEHVCGVDPAENLTSAAIKSGITTINGLFDTYNANIINGVIPKPDVIIARHVFAHVDDWNGFVKNLDVLASKETLIVIEVPYVLDMLEKIELDQLYHEHLSYVSIASIRALLEHSPFHIHRVLRFPIHGGAMVVMLRRNDSKAQPFPMPQEAVTAQMWEDFRNYANTSIHALKLKVDDLVANDKTVCGFGASAKSTVWMAACGFTREHIQFICDCTPNKIGRHSPGTDVPILPESAMMERKQDYAVLFIPNFRDEVIANNKSYLDDGGKFIIPGKTLEIV